MQRPPPIRSGPANDATWFGRFGERAAARWYRRAGYQVLARNWRCRQGEVDLVVARDGVVAFVEVKARASARYGSGLEAVDGRKQRRLRSVAGRWLAQAPEHFGDVRFDVVEVDRSGRLALHHDCF